MSLRAVASAGAGNTQISGGSINGTPVGATTPSTGAFTTLSTTSDTTLGTKIVSYGGVATVANGVPVEYAQALATSQAANISPTTLYAVPTLKGGMYRVNCYLVETQGATTSSTLPSCGITWTDQDSGVALSAQNITPTNAANAPGAFGTGVQVINAAPSTNIQYSTSNYASSGATAMQYALRIKLEYLG